MISVCDVFQGGGWTTPLKHNSQIGPFPQVGVEKKYV